MLNKISSNHNKVPNNIIRNYCVINPFKPNSKPAAGSDMIAVAFMDELHDGMDTYMMKSFKGIFSHAQGGAFCTGGNPANVRSRGHRSWGQGPNA